MEKVSLTINGIMVIAEAGTSILKSAEDNGIRIPTLCNHPHLDPVGACRLCIVEEQKSGRIVASCVTPVSQGMAVETDTPLLREHRRNIIRLMMANHPESCIVCNKGNRCELRLIAAELGVGTTGLYPMTHYMRLEQANPFIIRDLTKCILCGKCIRADHELVVVGAIDYNLRGIRSRPAAAHEMPLEKSTCTFCGTCVSMCPTAALMAKNTRYVGSPQKESSTVCGFCGIGCSLLVGSTDGQLVEINPSHKDGTVNRSTLCIRGHFAHDFLNAPGRLRVPLIRKGEGLEKATWDEALGLIAERLLSIKSKYGPQSIAFLGSSKCTLEENYLFQKIARAQVSSPNVDNGGSLAGRSVWKRVEERLDGGGRPRPLSELEHADVILVLGADPTQSVPVLGYYLKRASRMRGIPLIVADPRKTDLVSFSSLWLGLKPGTDSELIHGLSAMLLKIKSHNADFVTQFTRGFDQYLQSLSSLDLGRVSRETGLDIKVIEKAAGLMEGRRIAFVIGHGICGQRYSLDAIDAIINLSLMTGSLGGKGMGLYLIARENNEAGAWDMGTVPDALPGRRILSDGAVRKHWERAWRVSLSPDPGLSVFRMISEAERGNLKALYVMGENPVRVLPEPDRIARALGNLQFLVVQDILDTETSRLAHVVLPGAAFSEKHGSFTNMEGRIQSFDPALAPMGEAKPDWVILDLLGRRMGSWEPYRSIQSIRDEISKLVPEYADLAKSQDTVWVRGTSRFKLFRRDGRGDLIPFTSYSPIHAETAEEGYPLKAILGSLRCHLGSGTRTGQSERIKDYAVQGEAEISFDDARGMGIDDGDTVSIASPFGSVRKRVRLTRDLNPGFIFVPKAFQGNDVRTLVPLYSLDGAGSQGFNVISVRVEKNIVGAAVGNQSDRS
jgi:formate dehydrogenase alpha subunit